MSYKIAVGSTDGIHTNQSFGAATEFYIYEVTGTLYQLLEKRQFLGEITVGISKNDEESGSWESCGTGESCESNGGCGTRESSGSSGGCGTGESCGTGGGCHGGGQKQKTELISDCRAIVCKKIGFQVQKQLEKQAIISFDIECNVEEALRKITDYLDKIDRHQSLRGIRRK